MKSRAFVSRTLPIAALLLVVLFKFQNCAPAPNMVGANGSGDAIVRDIDQWNQQKIAFLNPQQSIPVDVNTISLQGLCVGSEKGQQIDYQVIVMKAIPEVLNAGHVECVGGNFELPLEDVQFNSCSERIQVRAARAGNANDYTETVLQPACSGS
jgi:hypothetical protein